MRVVRVGTYGALGSSGRALVSGATLNGPVSIVLDQRVVRVGS